MAFMHQRRFEALWRAVLALIGGKGLWLTALGRFWPSEAKRKHAIKAADRLLPRYGFLLQTLIWVAYEYLKIQGFLGYAYGIIGCSQYLFLPLIRISSLTGVWGVSGRSMFAGRGQLLSPPGSRDGAPGTYVPRRPGKCTLRSPLPARGSVLQRR